MKGRQEPRLANLPAFHTSDGAGVGNIIRVAGMEPFPWQDLVYKYVLARNEGGKLRFPTVGLSVPRQSGKTFGLMMLVIAESLRHKGLKTVWTTHRYKVTRETFREFVTILNLPAFYKHIEKITTGEGNQGVLFRNGSRILFAARENGALRGVSKIGRLILDEAQILSTDAVADLVPTMNAHPDPQVIYTGTPPRPGDPGDAFRRLRTRALEGDDRILYFEWSAPPNADLDDPATWAYAHPSLGFEFGTPFSRLHDLRTQLVTDENYGREALGMWDELESTSVIPMKLWTLLQTGFIDIESIKVLAAGVDIAPDRSQATVSLAMWHPEKQDTVHIEVAKTLPGVDWVVPYLSGLNKRRRFRALVVDTVGPAAALIEPMRSSGLTVTAIGTGQVVQATGMVYDRAMASTLSHVGGPDLNAAVSGASTRRVGDSWTWSRRGEAQITPLVAASFALYGLIMTAPAQPDRNRLKVSNTFYSFT